MSQITGRKAELEVLSSALESSQSEFIAITGRRRIGKTFLVNNFFEEHICFYLTGVQSQPIKVQLQAFANELSRRKHSIVSSPANWLEAFAVLRDYLETIESKQKKVVFFDELSWIDTQRSGFLQIFAHFWNSWAAWQRNIILIVAGSSTSWIVNKVYNDTGGLHNRVTKRLWLEPFTLAETEAFLKNKQINLTRYEISLLYMAFGGIPFYLNEIKAGESAAQSIERICFSEGGILNNEFDNLYASIFKNPEFHLRIVKTLAQRPYGMSRADLLKAAKAPNSGNASKVLDELVATGYVHHMLPYEKRVNGGKYILSDFYSRFYLNFIAKPKAEGWISQIDSSAYRAWCGIAFEWLCHFHKKEILLTLGISGIRTKISYLNIKDDAGKILAQIDMLIDRADNVINLCEIKFSNDVYALSKAEADNIRHKMSQLQKNLNKRKSIFPVMITTFGCEKNMHYLGLIHHQITLDDLFRI